MRPTRARYGVVGFSLTLAVIAYMHRVAIAQAAGPISAELHLSKTQMGLVFGAFALAYAACEMPMGALSDRVGVRRLLTPTVLFWSSCTALTGGAWNLTSLWVIRFLFGAGEAGCFPSLTKMLGTWLPAGERVKAQALMWACTRWGGAVTPPLTLLAITAVGWRMSFLLFGLIGLAWVLAFRFWFRDDPAEHRGVNAAELELLRDARALGATAHQDGFLKLFATPEIAALLLQYFLVSYVWYFYVTWLPTYLKEAWSLSGPAAAAYSVIPLMFGGFGSVISGMLPGRMARRWIAMAGLTATGGLLFLITRMTNVTAAMICMGLASFASDLALPISWNTCVEIGRRYTATLSGSMNAFANIAGFIAPVFGGMMLARRAGDWNALLYTMVAAGLGAALCWLFIHPDKDRSGAEASTR